MHTKVGDALRKVAGYGKGDTLGMDAGPEIAICHGLNEYDKGAVVVTEEAGTGGKQFSEPFRPNDPETLRTVFISDPTDRSSQLKAFLGGFPVKKRVGHIMADPESAKKWEHLYGGPASITGATSSISCVRRGLPIFSVFVNYNTQELCVSCAAGNKVLKLPEERPAHPIDVSYVMENGADIVFPSIGNDFMSMRRFTTFLGDATKIGYKENFDDSGLMDPKDAQSMLHYGLPGGPSRIMYLSTMQPKEAPIGFILANGEKITEWIHWLAFVRFAKKKMDASMPALTMYEVFQKRPWTKEGVLMSTPPNYSIFRQHGSQMYIDTAWLLRMPNPSHLRATLVIAPQDNRQIQRTSSQSGYRTITF